MTVIAFDPFAKQAPAGVTLTTLKDVLSKSHVVSLNCPLTDDNRHMINRATIAADARRRDPGEHRAAAAWSTTRR
jgi:D-3-phosphoglycerate dehydrogenase